MPFDLVYVRKLTDELRSKGVHFEAGLSDPEIEQAEREYAIKFPPDLRMLLQFALPVSQCFPNWRTDTVECPVVEWEGKTPVTRGSKFIPISDRMDWPADGICFDIERSNVWFDAWGPKPAVLSAAFEIARKRIAEMPRLIPVNGHRYLVGDPPIAGNPVFSVYQTDVIYYGNDLADYFAREFEVSRPDWAAREPRKIQFWTTLATCQ